MGKTIISYRGKSWPGKAGRGMAGHGKARSLAEL